MYPRKPQNGDPIWYVEEAAIQFRRDDQDWHKLLLQPGEIGQLDGEWWLCCPCGMSGSMEHQVEVENGVVTVTPSVVCPAGCHYFIKGGIVTGV